MNDATLQYDVVGLGVSTLDLLMVVDDFPCKEAVRRANDCVLEGGGPVATAMVTLARLGARTAMIDRLGDDWRGRLIIEEFQREGVATNHISIASNRSSSIASILVRRKDGARVITYSPGDAGEIEPADIADDLLASCRMLHVNGRHLQASLALAKKAKQRGVLVSFDGGAHRFSRDIVDLVKLSDICIVAREFAASFSGEASIDLAGAGFLQAGPKTVVITEGKKGSWVFDETGEGFHQPPFDPGRVLDTTGAGDAYHGAFLFGILRGYQLRECASLASAVAAMNTRKLGGRSALPAFREVQEFIAAHE